MLEIYKIPLVLGILGYASIVDYKTREVPNRLWKLMLPFALFFFVVELYMLHRYLIVLVSFVGLTFGALYLLYFASVIGGADLKGVMLLTLFFPHWHSNLLFVWITLCAASSCMMPLGLYYLYHKFWTKDIIEADKVLYSPFFPFLTAGFVLALFITPIVAV